MTRFLAETSGLFDAGRQSPFFAASLIQWTRMSNLNEKSAVNISRKPLWQRALIMLAGAASCALFALTFFPSAYERVARMIGQPISSAAASEGENFVSPAVARGQKLANAKTMVHGMFVKDPYGCAYMFQYLSAQLVLTPVLDENKHPVCNR